MTIFILRTVSNRLFFVFKAAADSCEQLILVDNNTNASNNVTTVSLSTAANSDIGKNAVVYGVVGAVIAVLVVLLIIVIVTVTLRNRKRNVTINERIDISKDIDAVNSAGPPPSSQYSQLPIGNAHMLVHEYKLKNALCY